MNISGSGHIAAGEYNEKISVSGSGKIDGNIRCNALACSGSVKAQGSVTCIEGLTASGSGHFEKSIKANNISVSGSCSYGEDITADNVIKASGSLKCGGNIRCAVLKSSGSIYAAKDIEADEIYISGRIECDGTLNGDKVDISLYCNSPAKAGSVVGSSIVVRNEMNGKTNTIFRLPLFKSLSGGSSCLTVDELIEGDSIAIEFVKAPKVVGRNVAIGANCEIDIVQYSEQIEIHPDAKVRKYEKV